MENFMDFSARQLTMDQINKLSDRISALEWLAWPRIDRLDKRISDVTDNLDEDYSELRERLDKLEDAMEKLSGRKTFGKKAESPYRPDKSYTWNLGIEDHRFDCGLRATTREMADICSKALEVPDEISFDKILRSAYEMGIDRPVGLHSMTINTVYDVHKAGYDHVWTPVIEEYPVSEPNEYDITFKSVPAHPEQ